MLAPIKCDCRVALRTKFSDLAEKQESLAAGCHVCVRAFSFFYCCGGRARRRRADYRASARHILFEGVQTSAKQTTTAVGARAPSGKVGKVGNVAPRRGRRRRRFVPQRVHAVRL